MTDQHANHPSFAGGTETTVVAPERQSPAGHHRVAVRRAGHAGKLGGSPTWRWPEPAVHVVTIPGPSRELKRLGCQCRIERLDKSNRSGTLRP